MKTHASGRAPDYWHAACAYLSERDEILATLIAAYRGEVLASRGDAFFSLARAVVGQQISVKAADSIWLRLTEALASEVRPQLILDTPSERLRLVGLSARKVLYLQEVAAFFVARANTRWHEQHDEAVVTDLIGIKGIGRWSAEMFLIFHLLRPDVLPLGDLGLRQAIERYYNRGETFTLTELTSIGERWRPYRTVATWYLWRSLDPISVAY